MRSDELFWQATADSIREAIRLEPDCWWCYVQLARLDDGNAEQLLQTSLEMNPYNSDAAIDLGLRYEADGSLDKAEALFLRAFAVDHTYPPRWTLANFYFRHNRISAFWTWVRRATEMPADDLGALFELCWRAAPDPKTIEANIVEENPEVQRQFVHFLIINDQEKAAVHPALRLIDSGYHDSDRELLFMLLERLIADDDGADADNLWRELIRENRIVADPSVPNNPKFSRDPLPVKFDWNFSAYSGLHSWPGSAGLITEFTGEQPEDYTIAEETIVLPAGHYQLDSWIQTKNIPPNTGIRWEIVEAKPETIQTNSQSLSSDTGKDVVVPFTVMADHSLLRLRLAYHRELGTPRVSGSLAVRSVGIKVSPSL